METNGVIEVKARTWEKDSHDLFDYESRSTENYRFLLRGSAKICRKLLDVQIIPDDSPVPEGYELLAGIHVSENGIFNFTPLFSRRSRTWLVVKELDNSSYTILQGDTINLGRFRLKVKQVVSDPESQATLCLTDSKSPVFVEPENPEQYQCRICLSEGGEPDDPLVAPCVCKGSIEYIHISCLKHWMLMKNNQYNAAARASQSTTNPHSADGSDVPLSYNYFRPIACELCHAVFPHALRVVTHERHTKEKLMDANSIHLEEPETTATENIATFDGGMECSDNVNSSTNKWKQTTTQVASTLHSEQETPDDDRELSLVDIPDVKPPFLILQNDAGSTIAEHFQQVVNRQPVQPLLKALHIISTSDGFRKCVKFGRGHEADVRVPDVSISRLHASINYEEEKIYVDEDTGEEVPESVAIDAAVSAAAAAKKRKARISAVGDASTRQTVDDEGDVYYRNSLLIHSDSPHGEAHVDAAAAETVNDSSSILQPVNNYAQETAGEFDHSASGDMEESMESEIVNANEDDDNTSKDECEGNGEDSDHGNGATNLGCNNNMDCVKGGQAMYHDDECMMQQSEYSEGGASTADVFMSTKRSYRCEIRRRLVLRDNSSKFGTLVSIQKPFGAVLSKLSDSDVPKFTQDYVKMMAIQDKLVSLPARFSELPPTASMTERLANQPVVTSKVTIQVGRSVLTFEVPSMEDADVIKALKEEGPNEPLPNCDAASMSSHDSTFEKPPLCRPFVRRVEFPQPPPANNTETNTQQPPYSPVSGDQAQLPSDVRLPPARFPGNENSNMFLMSPVDNNSHLMTNQQLHGVRNFSGVVGNVTSNSELFFNNNNSTSSGNNQPPHDYSGPEGRRIFTQFLHGLQSGFAPFFNVFGAAASRAAANEPNGVAQFAQPYMSTSSNNNGATLEAPMFEANAQYQTLLSLTPRQGLADAQRTNGEDLSGVGVQLYENLVSEMAAGDSGENDNNNTSEMAQDVNEDESGRQILGSLPRDDAGSGLGASDPQMRDARL